MFDINLFLSCPITTGNLSKLSSLITKLLRKKKNNKPRNPFYCCASKHNLDVKLKQNECPHVRESLLIKFVLFFLIKSPQIRIPVMLSMAFNCFQQSFNFLHDLSAILTMQLITDFLF